MRPVVWLKGAVVTALLGVLMMYVSQFMHRGADLFFDVGITVALLGIMAITMYVVVTFAFFPFIQKAKNILRVECNKMFVFQYLSIIFVLFCGERFIHHATDAYPLGIVVYIVLGLHYGYMYFGFRKRETEIKGHLARLTPT